MDGRMCCIYPGKRGQGTQFLRSHEKFNKHLNSICVINAPILAVGCTARNLKR